MPDNTLWNSSNWFHYAKIRPNASYPLLTVDDYNQGFYPNVSGMFIHPCSWLENGTVNYSTMVLTMGNVVDYYRPIAGFSACEMLTNNQYEWSPDNVNFYLPSRLGNGVPQLGGSAVDWPHSNQFDLRQWLSFWGHAGLPGGCCAYNKWTPSDLSYLTPQDIFHHWGKQFDLYWR